VVHCQQTRGPPIATPTPSSRLPSSVVDTTNLNPQLDLHLPCHDVGRRSRLTEHNLPKTTPLRRNSMPLTPLSPDQKVQVFTQGRQAAQKKEDRSIDASREETTSRDVAVIGPREAKLSPWHLNPVHSIGHGLSNAPAAALPDRATCCRRCRQPPSQNSPPWHIPRPPGKVRALAAQIWPSGSSSGHRHADAYPRRNRSRRS
jgi:hypothetical protein